ncbi:MAG TPA: aldo/keto reductase [Nocardioidaceae bacterium]|nr:aldo/keto reductase [Nocardioidaceae bacterium]
MEQRPLGDTGLTSSRLVLGTMTFGSQVDEATATEMVARALDAGITHLDTANSYNDGRSEEIVGRALGSRRDEVVLASKVFNRFGPAPDEQGLSAPAVRKAIDASLRRLGTDHLDIYYLHQPDWTVPIEETLTVMAELVDAGKVRHVGVSNYAAWQICEIRNLVERDGWPPVVVSQQMYNLLARSIEDEYAAFSEHAGLADVVYNPLAGGLLTGKHQYGEAPSTGRFIQESYRDRYWTKGQFEAVARLGEVAAGAGLSLVELSLRWLLSRPVVDAVLLGASSLAQLEANLAAAEGPAPDEATLAACDGVWRELRGPIPRYNR